MYPVWHEHTDDLQKLAYLVPLHCLSCTHDSLTAMFSLKEEKKKDCKFECYKTLFCYEQFDIFNSSEIVILPFRQFSFTMIYPGLQ